MAAQEELWWGPEFKRAGAAYHFERMHMALMPREMDAHTAAMAYAGAIIHHDWQRQVYFHFDAFLMTARSIPEVINCCFGHDQSSRLQAWFDSLPADEQRRRDQFSLAFRPAYDAFRAVPLSNVRHISEHRTGLPGNVEVTVSGTLGVVYSGGPSKPVPLTETPEIKNPSMAPLVRARQVPPPRTEDFAVDGRPLFAECTNYLSEVEVLIEAARRCAAAVHGTSALTPPPA